MQVEGTQGFVPSVSDRVVLLYSQRVALYYQTLTHSLAMIGSVLHSSKRMNNWLSGVAYLNSLHICGNVIAMELLKCTLSMLTYHYRHPLLLVEKFGIMVLGYS